MRKPNKAVIQDLDENNDGETMPMVDPQCPQCGVRVSQSRGSSIEQSTAIEFDGVNHRMWRVRIVAKCECGKETIYRLCGSVVRNGSFVPKEQP